MIWIGIGIVVVLAVMVGVAALALFRIVPPSEAHLVVSLSKKMVCSSDPGIQKNAKAWYFAIPIIRTIRQIDLTTKEIIDQQETYEKGQARYKVRTSLKYRVQDVEIAAETFHTDEALREQLKEVLRAGVRAITVKYDVKQARAEKKTIDKEIKEEIEDDLAKWGIKLINFQLVDFQDTDDSNIISDISRVREKEIEALRREQNAEKNKVARMKEAEADEKSQEREIARDQLVGERQQTMKQKIAEQEKLAREKEYDVKQVEIVKAQEIDKKRAEVEAEQQRRVAVIKANQMKEAEIIYKEQKELEGQGDRARLEEQAKGNAAKMKEDGLAEAEALKAKGLAEAEAKNALQKALNQFKDEAIRALVAEKIVDMQKVVGIEGAKALSAADIKMLVSGGDGSKEAFEVGKLLESLSVANGSMADSILNRLAKPNDLGMGSINLKDIAKTENKKSAKQ